MKTLAAFYCFLVTKIAFKNSLEFYFHPFIIKFFCFAKLQLRFEEKIHTKAVVDVSRVVGKELSCFPERDWKGIRRKLLPLVKLH